MDILDKTQDFQQPTQLSAYEDILEKPQKQQNSINDAVERLGKFIYHEKCCPVILPYQIEIMEGTYFEGKKVSHGILELVYQQQEGIQVMQNELKETKDKQSMSLFLLLHVMELERIKFLIKEYLRVRLQKIGQFAFHIENNALETLLSQPERNHLKQFVQLKQTYFFKMSLDNYRKQFRVFGLRSEDVGKKSQETINHPQPNENKCVMVRIKTPRSINLGQKQLNQGDILFLPYKEVQQLNALEYIDFI